MPWRARYITSRRHPLAVAVYVLLLVMGVLFLTGAFDSRALTDVIGAGWQDAWQWLLVVGGTGGVAGVLWPERRLDDALAIEMAGATASFFGLTVYAVAVVLAAGWGNAAWLLFGVLAAGCAVRAEQTRREMGRLDELAASVAERRGK
jgi:predicted MFS family arabinose efflux permease